MTLKNIFVLLKHAIICGFVCLTWGKTITYNFNFTHSKDPAKIASELYSDPVFIRKLRNNGVVHLPNAIPPHLIRRALRDLNIFMSQKDTWSQWGGLGGIVAGGMPKESKEITDLFNESFLKHLFPMFFGTIKNGEKLDYAQKKGQVCLRFPEHCSAHCDHTEFDSPEPVRKQRYLEGIQRTSPPWHFDGVLSGPNPSPQSIAQQREVDKIFNFDALIGILLSDVPLILSGELCVYPGSVRGLSEYFQSNKSAIPHVRQEGIGRALQPLTEKLLGTEPHHCTGRAGDVFIANYLTAHYLCPNFSPNIRYKVYFRVKGPKFPGGMNGPQFFGVEEMVQDSLEQPWLHWTFHDAK